jgi:hypothetical protein
LPIARVRRWLPPIPGDDAERDFGLAELRAVGGDDEVGHHRQLAPAAEREAVDRGDPRLAGGLDEVRGPAREHVSGVEPGCRHGGHLADVGPGGERLFARAGDDRASLGRVAFERGESGDQVLEHGAAERVEGLGPVERDQRDGAALFDEDGGVVCHTTPKASMASATFLNPAILAPLT